MITKSDDVNCYFRGLIKVNRDDCSWVVYLLRYPTVTREEDRLPGLTDYLVLPNGCAVIQAAIHRPQISANEGKKH